MKQFVDQHPKDQTKIIRVEIQYRGIISIKRNNEISFRKYFYLEFISKNVIFRKLFGKMRT